MKKGCFRVNGSCHFCQLFPLCVPEGLTEGELIALQATIDQRYVLEKGETLIRDQDPLKYLYALRSGSAKGWIMTPQGQERVVDFYFPGEIIGLHALAKKQHSFSITCLEKSTICRLNYHQLLKIMDRSSGVRSQLLALASDKLNAQAAFLQHNGAEQRLLAFLHHLQKRLQGCGVSVSGELKLSMSRVDIANFLDLAPETVSRLFTRLKQKGLVCSQGLRVIFPYS